eukprot:Ihof_evm11s87 gene=Ihof_evmTU11s87
MEFNFDSAIQQLQRLQPPRGPHPGTYKTDLPMPQFSNAMQQDLVIEKAFDEASFDAAFSRFLANHSTMGEQNDSNLNSSLQPHMGGPSINMPANMGPSRGPNMGVNINVQQHNINVQQHGNMNMHHTMAPPSLTSDQFGNIYSTSPISHHMSRQSSPYTTMSPRNVPQGAALSPRDLLQTSLTETFNRKFSIGSNPSSQSFSSPPLSHVSTPGFSGPPHTVFPTAMQNVPFGMEHARPVPISNSQKYPIPANTQPTFSQNGFDDEDDDRQAKRFSHIVSEQKRRNNIKDGFKVIQDVLPSVRPGTTRAVLLRRAVDYINTLKRTNKELAKQVLQGGGQVDPHPTSSAEEKEYEAVVNAINTKLRISAKLPPPEYEMSYKSDRHRIAITCGEDLIDLFELHQGSPSDEVKINVYIKKPPQYRKSAEDEPGAEKRPILRVQEGKNVGIQEEEHNWEHLHQLDDKAEDYEVMDFFVDVDPVLIEQLFQELRSNPLMSAGSGLYQIEEWQRSRIRRSLRVCNNDINDARTFLLNHLEWLHKVRPEDITKEELLRELKLNKLYWHKCDLKGNPVLYCRVNRHQTEAGDGKYANVKLWLYKLNEFETVRADSPYRKFTIIYDRRGASIENSDVWLLRKVLQILQVNYVGMVHRIHVINPDYAFLYGYNLLKGMLTHEFRERIKFLDDS